MAVIGRNAMGGARKRRAVTRLAVGLASALALLAFPALGLGSHSRGGDSRDFAVGSGTNQFIVVLGDAQLSVSAHSDPAGGRPSGHVRAQGEPDGDGPNEPFELEGEVTCLKVSGNRAAIKYRFKHAEGSAEPFQDGGVQIFIEDNGDPKGGQPVDRATFDPPQPAGVYDAGAAFCDDPRTRLGYDGIESGDFGV